MAQSYAPYEPQQQGRLADQAAELGQQALDRTAEAAVATRDTVTKYPATSLVVAAGLGFAIGALWKIGRSHPSRTELLQTRLAELYNQVPRRWRP